MKSEKAKAQIRECRFAGQAGYDLISVVNAERAVEFAEQDAEASVAPMVKFCKKMAKHENGCVPAVWYFDELIELARLALKRYDKNE
ncbi:MAG: hypothetical protein LBV18_03940 [Alistipes sp.]|jgi:hypothetical protein|nr:hypothetical protein [Alistipes sp.]